MDDAEPVRFAECGGDVFDDLDSARQGECARTHQRAEVLPVDQLQHDEGATVRGLAVIVERGDVRMTERRDRARFAQETRVIVARLRRVHRNLDCDAATKQRVLRDIDHAHAAFA